MSNMRVMGPSDLVEQLQMIIGGKVYPNRRQQGASRLYIEIDDRKLQRLIDILQQNKSEIDKQLLELWPSREKRG